MTVLLPSTKQRSRFLFDWSAADCLAAPEQSLDANTGQVATYSRASIKTALDANLALRTVPHSLPAFQWATDPVSGLKVPGVLLEGPATNGILQSETFGTSWAATSVTVSSNTAAAPNGSTTADSILETVANSEHYVQQTAVATADNSTVSVSVYAKPLNRDLFYLAIIKKDGATVVGAFFNLTTGVISSVSGGVTARIVACANGWYRCIIVVASVGAGASTPTVRLQCSNTTAPLIYAGTITNGVYLWGAQYEVALYETSYIPTTTVTVTRATDALSFAYNAPPQAMTAYVKFVEAGTIITSGSVRGLFGITDSSRTSPAFLIEQGGTGVYRTDTTDLGATGTSILAAAPTIGQSVELRATLSAAGSVNIGQSIAGAAETTGGASTALALAAAFSGTTLWLNGNPGGFQAASLIQKVRVAAGVQTLAFMQAG